MINSVTMCWLDLQISMDQRIHSIVSYIFKSVTIRISVVSPSDFLNFNQVIYIRKRRWIMQTRFIENSSEKNVSLYVREI